MGQAHVIVVGNEKGGTGKSTLSMHILVALLYRGLSVGSIDVDARQGTLTRYLENRRARDQKGDLGLPSSEHRSIPPSADAQADAARLLETIAELRDRHDVVVIDTPGSDNALSRLAHSYAQTLVTPLNDSLIDLDVLAHVEPETMRIARPSQYAELVWDTKKQRALRGERAVVDWIVVRNRLSSLDARNKRDMEKLLSDLAQRIGFRLVPGLGERVIYRSLFLDGLTLLDLRNSLLGFQLSMSHLTARQELRGLVDALNLDIQGAVAPAE